MGAAACSGSTRVTWAVDRMTDLPHVWPVGDLREHAISMDCWCRPVDDEGVIVHNSMDGREQFERGRMAS